MTAAWPCPAHFLFSKAVDLKAQYCGYTALDLCLSEARKAISLEVKDEYMQLHGMIQESVKPKKSKPKPQEGARAPRLTHAR